MRASAGDAFLGCSTKLNKTFKTNIIEILLLIMCIPRKINITFIQLTQYNGRLLAKIVNSFIFRSIIEGKKLAVNLLLRPNNPQALWFCGSLVLWLFLEVLVVFEASPLASPLEAVGLEEPISEVVTGYLIGKVLGAVGIRAPFLRTDQESPILAALDVGIVERVEVDRHPARMIGELAGIGHVAKVEGRGIICPHRPYVVGLVIVDKLHPFYRIAGLVKLAENIDQVTGNSYVTDHLASASCPLGVDIEEPEVAEGVAGDRTVLLIGFAHHTVENDVVDFFGDKPVVKVGHLFRCHDGRWLP